MRYKNHRKGYSLETINTLRKRVADAYYTCTQEVFEQGSYKLSYSYNTLTELLKKYECGYLSNSTLHKFFTDGHELPNNEISFAESTISTLTCFADKIQSAKSRESKQTIVEDSEELIKTIKLLQQLYEEDEILVGVEKANQAYSKFGVHPKILRHAFRFNMRVKDWQKINSIIDGLPTEELNDEIKGLCNLALFECELREAYSNLRFDRNEQNKKIRYAKKYLDRVPESQHSNKEYWYWKGRWYLELWYSTGGSDNTDLKLSLSHFEKSLQLRYSWFVHCYKCMALKLLGRKDFKGELKKYTDVIIEEKIKQPKRPAVRTYRIASFVLSDDMNGLKKFLKEHNSPASATDFQSTIFHHIELIFFQDNKRQEHYRNVLKNWDNNLPIK